MPLSALQFRTSTDRSVANCPLSEQPQGPERTPRGYPCPARHWTSDTRGSFRDGAHGGGFLRILSSMNGVPHVAEGPEEEVRDSFRSIWVSPNSDANESLIVLLRRSVVDRPSL
jgi:hypothetical protein